VEIYEDFIVDCINRLKAMFDTISALDRNNDNMTRITQEAQRMIRVLTILRVYIADCDEAYSDERAILPLYRHVVMMNSVFFVCSQFIILCWHVDLIRGVYIMLVVLEYAPI